MRPYPSTNGYTNWELSADRANAARRALTAGGLPDAKISRVVGLSSSVLFNKAEPQSPINRRISIVVMTKQAEEAALKTDVADQPTSASASPAPLPSPVAASADRSPIAASPTATSAPSAAMTASALAAAQAVLTPNAKPARN
jgi:chemotaxis protein MotB